nr:uncharacterized protein LOC110283473 [Parasteatoda tepidariorum]
MGNNMISEQETDMVFTTEQSTFLSYYSRKTSKFGINYATHFDNIYSAFLGTGDSNTVKEVLELSKEIKMDFCKIFKGKLRRIFYTYKDFSHLCLVNCLQNFIVVTDYGAMNEFYGHESPTCFESATGLYSMTTLNLAWRNGCSEFELKTSIENCPENFRSLQLLHLYFKSKQHGTLSMSEKALQVLWSSIPDPLLTRSQFSRIFVERKDRHKPSKDMVDAWNWYCRLVRDTESCQKCPRSLKHLSRCTIRQRLKENLLLPEAVDVLPIPKTCKKYLVLKDFGEIN